MPCAGPYRSLPKAVKPWWKRWWAIAGAVILVFGVIGAASGGDEEEPENASASEQPTTTTAAPTTTSEATTISATPRPNGGQRASLEAELALIYPGAPEGKYADWAVNTCSDMLRGVAGPELEGNVIHRYSGGSRPDPTPDQARQIIAVIEANGFCTPEPEEGQ